MVELLRKVKKSSSHLIAVQAIFLSSLLVFPLIMRLLKYTFVPSNIVISIILDFSVLFVFILLVIKIIKKNEKTKLSIIISMLLPFIVILHYILRFFTINHKFFDYMYMNIAYLFFIFLFSIIQVFICAGNGNIRIILGIIYIIILSVLFYIGCIFIVFSSIGKQTVVKTLFSPNVKYKVEVIYSDLGATGENTNVGISRANSDLNILIGIFTKDRKLLYRTKRPEGISLEWETDKIIYIDNEKYVVE